MSEDEEKGGQRKRRPDGARPASRKEARPASDKTGAQRDGARPASDKTGAHRDGARPASDKTGAQRDGARPAQRRRRPAQQSGSEHPQGKRPDAKRKRPPQRKPQAKSAAASPSRQTWMVIGAAGLAGLLVGALVATLVVRAMLVPQLNDAKDRAAASQEQAIKLSGQVSQLTEELDAANAKSKKGSSSSTSDSDEADDDGDSSSSQGVKDPWLKDGSYFTTGDSKLDQEVKEFCDGIVSTDMDLDAAALEVYKGVAWSDYVERDSAQDPATVGKGWRITYARQFFENSNSGNCYEFAAALMYCLRYLGFSDAHAEGVLLELQDGGWGDHGIVYVTNTDGTSSMCDTARGTNGWMLPAGSYNVQLQDFESA